MNTVAKKTTKSTKNPSGLRVVKTNKFTPTPAQLAEAKELEIEDAKEVAKPAEHPASEVDTIISHLGVAITSLVYSSVSDSKQADDLHCLLFDLRERMRDVHAALVATRPEPQRPEHLDGVRDALELLELAMRGRMPDPHDRAWADLAIANVLRAIERAEYQIRPGVAS